MLTVFAASNKSLQVLACLLCAVCCSGDHADDAFVFVQSSLKLSVAADGLGWSTQGPSGWEDEVSGESFSTIGNISPRMIDEDSSESTLKGQSPDPEPVELAQKQKTQATITESQVDVLVSAVGNSLGRIGSKLDFLLNTTAQFQEKLLHTTNHSTSARLSALEDAMLNDPMETIAQGWMTLTVLLRSTVQSTESKLETVGLRDFAAQMGTSLGDALQQFDIVSQMVFKELNECADGLGDATPERANERVLRMQAQLKSYCRDANSFAHAVHQNFQGLAKTAADLAMQSALPAVSLQRVNLVLDDVQQAAAAVAWKIYSGTWMLATGVLIATADPSKSRDFGVQVDEESLVGETVPSETAAPLKPAEAQSVTAAMFKMESQVDELINRTKQEMKALMATESAAPKPSPSDGLAQIRQTITSKILPGWWKVGEQLRGTSLQINHCLATAGQEELAKRLYWMVVNVSGVSGAVLVHGPNGVGNLTSDLDAFLQQEDVLAHFFYRAFAEFIAGLSRSPGRQVAQHEVALVQGGRPADVSLRGGEANISVVLDRRRDDPPKDRIVGGTPEQGHPRFCSATSLSKSRHRLAPGGPPREAAVSLPRQETAALLQSVFSGEEKDTDVAPKQDAAAEAAAARTAAVQEAASLAWKIHSAAWVLVMDAHKVVAQLG